MESDESCVQESPTVSSSQADEEPEAKGVHAQVKGELSVQTGLWWKIVIADTVHRS